MALMEEGKITQAELAEKLGMASAEAGCPGSAATAAAGGPPAFAIGDSVVVKSEVRAHGCAHTKGAHQAHTKHFTKCLPTAAAPAGPGDGLAEAAPPHAGLHLRQSRGRVISDCHFRKTGTEHDRKPSWYKVVELYWKVAIGYNPRSGSWSGSAAPSRTPSC
jgi:hypothetical protein